MQFQASGDAAANNRKAERPREVRARRDEKTFSRDSIAHYSARLPFPSSWFWFLQLPMYPHSKADGRNAIIEFDGKNDGKNQENRDIANLRKLTGGVGKSVSRLSIEKSGALTRLLSTT